MLPYLIMQALPSLLAITYDHRYSRLIGSYIFIAFVIFMGLRYQVGPDWSQYYSINEFLRNQDFSYILSNREPLSYGIFWISSYLGGEVYFSHLVMSALVMIGVFSFARKCYNPWLAIVAATPYFIFIVGMSGVRQMAAAGVLLFLVSNYTRFSVLMRVFIVVIAALFHTSAMVGLIFVGFHLKMRIIYKIIVSAFILGIAYFATSETVFFSNSIDNYIDRYIEGKGQNESFGAIFHIAMILAPALAALFYRRRILPYVHDPALLNFGIYGSIFVFVMFLVNLFNSTLPSRLTIYFYFVPMMIYPALTMVFGRKYHKMFTLLFLLLHFLILVVWMQFANHSYAYIPYQNILF